jgi:type II secretion system protein G
MRKMKGFTLIELLIVVAIFAILAAIAIPNFIEAQVRSKVSRVKADMRSVATALESYRVDHPAYPAGSGTVVQAVQDGKPQVVLNPVVLAPLTTPIAYISSIPKDAFDRRWRPTAADGMQRVPEEDAALKYYAYRGPAWKTWMIGRRPELNVSHDSGKMWVLSSPGPNNTQSFGNMVEFQCTP